MAPLPTTPPTRVVRATGVAPVAKGIIAPPAETPVAPVAPTPVAP